MAEGICTSCGCDRALHARGMCKPCYRKDHYARNTQHERATMAAWREKNRAYDRQRWADYYAANGERLRQQSRDYTAQNRDEVLRKGAEWRAKNREMLRERNKRSRRNDPNWPLRNRENARRRAKAPGGDKVDYAAILAEYGMVCHLCHRGIATLDDLHMDHVIPLVRGGPHHPDNIRPAHALCNMRKGARLGD